MAGTGSVVYLLTLTGDAEAARHRVAAQSWVSSATLGPANGTTPLAVGVTDTQAAEARLLRLVMEDEGMTVITFGRKQYNLEDVFLDMVEGGTPNGTI